MFILHLSNIMNISVRRTSKCMQMKLINYLFIITFTVCAATLTEDNNKQLFVQETKCKRI